MSGFPIPVCCVRAPTQCVAGPLPIYGVYMMPASPCVAYQCYETSMVLPVGAKGEGKKAIKEKKKEKEKEKDEEGGEEKEEKDKTVGEEVRKADAKLRHSKKKEKNKENKENKDAEKNKSAVAVVAKDNKKALTAPENRPSGPRKTTKIRRTRSKTLLRGSDSQHQKKICTDTRSITTTVVESVVPSAASSSKVKLTATDAHKTSKANEEGKDGGDKGSDTGMQPKDDITTNGDRNSRSGKGSKSHSVKSLSASTINFSSKGSTTMSSAKGIKVKHQLSIRQSKAPSSALEPIEEEDPAANEADKKEESIKVSDILTTERKTKGTLQNSKKAEKPDNDLAFDAKARKYSTSILAKKPDKDSPPHKPTNSKHSSQTTSSFADDLEAAGGDKVAAWSTRLSISQSSTHSHRSHSTTSISDLQLVRNSSRAASSKPSRSSSENKPTSNSTTATATASASATASHSDPHPASSSYTSTQTDLTNPAIPLMSGGLPDSYPIHPQSPGPMLYAPLRNPLFPPPLRPGTNYMFPQEHTTLHVFRDAVKPWEAKDNKDSTDDEEKDAQRRRGSKSGRKKGLVYHIFRMSTGTSVAEVIRNVLSLRVQGDYIDCAHWAATEVIPQENGTWTKGTTIQCNSAEAARTLASLGWNSQRGETLPAVWITVHNK